MIHTAYHAFGQRDEHWGDVPLGTGGGQTLASAGCLVTALSGALADMGVDTDPGRLNRQLCREGGFSGGNLLVFSRPATLYQLSVAIVDCYSIPAPLTSIANALEARSEVLVLVDFKPGGGVNQHWVRLLDPVESGGEVVDFRIHDPWLSGDYNDARTWLMARYGHYSWDSPDRAIFRLAIYAREEAGLGLFRRQFEEVAHPLFGPASQVQERVYVHPARRGMLRRWLKL